MKRLRISSENLNQNRKGDQLGRGSRFMIPLETEDAGLPTAVWEKSPR